MIAERMFIFYNLLHGVIQHLQRTEKYVHNSVLVIQSLVTFLKQKIQINSLTAMERFHSRDLQSCGNQMTMAMAAMLVFLTKEDN